jgi:hypothetical protein
MELKPITKENNKRTIIVNYSLALIFVAIGLFTSNAAWYILAVVFVLFASVRKYFLMKRLTE